MHEPTTRFSVYSVATTEKFRRKRNEATNVSSSGGGKENNESKKEGTKAALNGEKTKQTARNVASKAFPDHVSCSLARNADSNPIGSNLTVSSSETDGDLDAMRAAVVKTGAEVRQMKKVMAFFIRSPAKGKNAAALMRSKYA